MSWKTRTKFIEAQNHLKEDRLDEAEKVYSEVLAADAGSVEALLHRAYVREKLLRFDDALQDIDSFISARPENAVGYLFQGEILLKKNDAAAAKIALTKACQLEKDNGRAYFHLGEACIKLGKKDDAADCFEQALEFERDYVMARWMVASSS